MNDTSENSPKKHIIIGLLAHVDAGKTTLAENLLYQSGATRTLGRVDHGDAFLDTHELEKSRGITIFSKQAQLSILDKNITLLDTPGHADFSGEMERTLQVLDYAVLIISGADGVSGHVETLWKLLSRYRIPVFLFVNKMDQEGTDREALLKELKGRLSESCLDFSEDTRTDAQGRESFLECLALCDEKVMDHYLETEEVTVGQICGLIRSRKVFPCYFGSALKQQGIREFMEGLSVYTEYPSYPEEFGARIYKISRDARGNRLTHLKVTGGSLRVKALLSGREKEWEEKADQIRSYSGTGFTLLKEAEAGVVCAVTGLTKTFAGEGLGREEAVNIPMLEPVLSYRLILPEEVNIHRMQNSLRQLEEEEPLLHILWQEETGEIHLQLMGQVQIEVLKAIIKERFGVEADFGVGSVVYKETITAPVEGVGHFEPLRHYAEVHLLLEPGEAGSGLQFAAACSEEVLNKNWQHQVLTHLREKKHRGVLTGSEITDMKITLIAGRAHQKHTEGGDFRQAACRALRQGLKMADSRLLEPVYQFRLEVPMENVGRAVSDLKRMQGSFSGPEQSGEMSFLTGTVPVAAMQDYQAEVISYTKGKGRLFCSLKGYEPCRNEEKVIAAAGYDSERDLENPTGSVFCAHGAGFVVSYDKVYEYMHVEGLLAGKAFGMEESEGPVETPGGYSGIAGRYDEKELEAIFKRTYGDLKQQRRSWPKRAVYQPKEPEVMDKHQRPRADAEEYLLVDGYNVIFSWEELKELAAVNIEAARNRLMDILCNYQGYKKNILILVFDAYKVEGNPGSSRKYHNIHVVYTKEAETADQYIEKVTHDIGRKHRVTVATSDALEQMIILGQGAHRLSARGLQEEIQAASLEISRELKEKGTSAKGGRLFEQLPAKLAGELEDLRLGRADLPET